MWLIQFAIANPVKVTVAVILVCLFGTLCIFEIPKQLTPDVDQPIITVSTRWSGASPQEIESEIIDRQEEKLKSVSGLRKMTSVSQQNAGTVSLEFDVGVDKDAALRDVSEKLRQVSGYPEEVDEPTITASDSDMSRTIAWLMLRGDGDVDVSKLKKFAEDKIKPILERAEGISSVDVYGGLEREIQVRVDAHKLAARRLSFRDIERALRQQNRNISAGTIIQGKRDYTYRTIGEFTSLAEIEATVIAYQAGGPVHVRDVARVVDGFKKQFGFVRSKGEFVIALPARRETGANVLTTMEKLNEQIRIVNEEILPTVDSRLHLTQSYDESVYIRSAIDLVVNNILVGGLLAVVVLLVFLRSASATGIVALAIPISVMGTILVITLMGRTLNIVMLAGLAFAVGMVVDNAIVVLENIFRHRQMGKSRSAAAYDGAREVWGAVLASTLTTMAVFLPVVFIKEEAGQLFGDIAIAISSAVAWSLVVSVLVISPVAARFLGRGQQKSSSSSGTTQSDDGAWFFARFMAAVVGWINRSTLSRVAVILVFTGASIAGSYFLMPDSDYLPAGNRNLIFGFLLSPAGYSVEEFKKMAAVVEDGDPNDPTDGLRPYWEAELGSKQAAELPTVDVQIGFGAKHTVAVHPSPIENFFFVSFGGGSFMGCTSKEETKVSPLVTVMNNAGHRLPGVFTFFSQSSLFGRGLSGGNSIELEVRCDDYSKVVAATKSISRQVMQLDGFGYPRADPSNYDLGRPEIQIIQDRAKAADLGLDVQDIGFIVEASVNGAFVGEYNDHGDRIDMAILVDGMERATVQEVGQVPVYTASGDIVPLASAVSLVTTTAPQQINHVEEMPAVSLAITAPAGTALQTAMNLVREQVVAPLRKSGQIDPSVQIALAGNADKLTTTQHALIGDFSGTINGPRWLGGSIAITMAVLFVASCMLVLGIRLAVGYQPAVRVGAILMVGLAVLFLAINPQFALMLVQSRAILSAIIIYMLMAALFESFVYPFVIMFSVPLAAVGGFAALRIVHEVSLVDIASPIQQFDVLTMLGFIILLGIVVNNAILVVHQALTNMREYGMETAEAVKQSVRVRTRPIFMSALTSIFGMLPLVLMTGAGSELYRGIGSVVVGGLLLSTLFTLFVVPAMFSLLLDWKGAAAESRTTEVSMPAPQPAGVSTVTRPQINRSPD